MNAAEGMKTYTGECFGGPYDGERHSASGKRFAVDIFSGFVPSLEVNPEPAPNLPPIIVQTGWYLWSDTRARWEWDAP